MTSKLAPLALAAALAVVPITAQAAKPPKGGQLSISASRPTITFGGSTVLSGKLTATNPSAGQSVDIEADLSPAYTGFKRVATVLTDATGAWTATVKPGVITRYRAVAKTAPATTSATVTIGVRIRVGTVVSDTTPVRGARVTFSGHAYPAHDGKLVSIQRRSSTGAWVTVARTTLLDDGTARSRYTRSVRIPSTGSYRVRVSSGNDGDHLAGVGRARTLRVH